MEKLLDKIMNNLDFKGNTIIGIDGLGGSGKSTLADLLKVELEKSNHKPFLLHIDDFIYPRNVRYNNSKEEWYCYYYLQWRYDYLIDEILKPFKDGLEIHKEIEFYDKENDVYILKEVNIPQASIILLEGVFLQRQEIRDYLDHVIYLDVPKEVRLSRLLKRDIYIGDMEDIKSKYENRYFPAEDKYIEEYSPNSGDGSFCLSL